MNHLTHPTPSLLSRIIQSVLGIMGLKRVVTNRFIHNRFLKNPAPIPASLRRKADVVAEAFQGRKVWSIRPKKSRPTMVVLFLHGGAYYANITRLHWQFIEQLMKRNKVAFVVPDYPLAPETDCLATYRYLDGVYQRMISQNPDSELVFMGDSAGGGLALGFAMQVRDSGQRAPARIVLFSPWLDVSMSNPEISDCDARDKLLHVQGLAKAGTHYAGDLDTTDFRVSPIYGNFKNLGEISLFVGTNELMLADARKLKRITEAQGISIRYHEYPGMFHDWILVPSLKETRQVIQQVKEGLGV